MRPNLGLKLLSKNREMSGIAIKSNLADKVCSLTLTFSLPKCFSVELGRCRVDICISKKSTNHGGTLNSGL